MNIKKTILTPVLALVTLALVMGYMSGLFKQQVQPGVDSPVSDNVFTQQFRVQVEAQQGFEPVSASIEARENTQISSRIMAQISEIKVRAGTQVNQGDLLILLNSEDLEAQLARSNAQASSLKALLDDSQQTLRRITELHQQNLASVSELDNAKAANANLQSQHQAAIQAAEQARTQLSYSRIKSPFSGVIVDRSAEPGDTALPGKALITLFNPQTLLVEVQIRESVAIKFKLGDQLIVEVDSLNRRFEADIIEIVPAANRSARSFTVKAKLPLLDQARPGMYARVLLPLEDENITLIPKIYVNQFGQLNMVMVKQGDQVQRRFVRLGRDFGDSVEVVSGLDAEEIIVI